MHHETSDWQNATRLAGQRRMRFEVPDDVRNISTAFKSAETSCGGTVQEFLKANASAALAAQTDGRCSHGRLVGN